MSLNWDIEKVAPSEHVAYLGENDPETKRYSGYDSWPSEWKNEAATTEACVWSTMAIGIGHWTDEMIDEVVWRLATYQSVNGPLMVGPEGPFPIPEEHVRALVGLSTNVPYEPRNKWLVRVFGQTEGQRVKRYEERLRLDAKRAAHGREVKA